jgi:primosomal protein N' (replication factor Y)
MGTFVLYGVTGSGKTEVFLGAAQATLDAGRQVLVLVPEIGLTPQLVGRFRARFGDSVAVLHSALTGTERLAEWRRIRAREARVAVGARSALFAPFHDLGLIVVDEEHDDSYKQDDGVRYSARDLAVVLGKLHSAPVVLASATPSLETWHNARLGRYALLPLPRRATPRPVPEVELFDLTALEASGDEPRPLFHPDVVQGLADCFAEGGKAIVLYNRRGYATMVQCETCGGSYECPNCGITMTLHRQANVVACHYCALRLPYDGKCPSCHHPGLEEMGKGTERVAEELARLFPDVPQARMDADTTAVRGSHHRILEAFRTGRARLLVGTQIVAKGHDFPDVHVAVVVSADHGFRLPDFRAAERTWALLVQLGGRAGRGEKPGRILLQTWCPEHYVLHHLDHADAFYEAESRIRKTLRYPPFSRLCLVRIENIDRNRAREAAMALGKRLRALAAGVLGVEVLGPAPAALPRLVGRWRWQLILRGTETRPFREFLERARAAAKEERGTRITLDVDPRHIM